jgi:fumarate reductase subunit C
MKLANGNYIRPPARYSWWLRRGRYLRYMMRELSSLFIGIFSMTMVWGLFRLSQGEEAFLLWTNMLWSYSVGLFVVTLLFALYHSYSWFIVTPKAMPMTIAGKKVPARIIVAAHLLLWLFCSILVWVTFVEGGGI